MPIQWLTLTPFEVVIIAVVIIVLDLPKHEPFFKRLNKSLMWLEVFEMYTVFSNFLWITSLHPLQTWLFHTAYSSLLLWTWPLAYEFLILWGKIRLATCLGSTQSLICMLYFYYLGKAKRPNLMRSFSQYRRHLTHIVSHFLDDNVVYC